MNKRRTLFILFHGRFPSEKAAALFVAENARSFAEHFNVVIVVPKRRRPSGESITSLGLMNSVRVVYLPVLDLFGAPFISFLAFYISMLSYLPFAVAYLLLHAHKDDCIISNDFLLGLAASFSKARVVFEVHDYPEHWKYFYRALFKRAALIIATNTWKFQSLISDFPQCQGKTTMERNAVDIGQFAGARSKQESRKVLNLPGHGPLVIYTGHLFRWKGIETLIAAARELPDIRFVCVGGTAGETQRFREGNASFKNITFTGHVSHAFISTWQEAADVLVLPNTAREEISARYTSPMKLFEYMASRRPVVASRIPSIEEIVNDDMAYLFEPDNATALKEAIQTALRDEGGARARVKKARAWVEDHTWKARAERLMQLPPFITQTP